ncbi:Ankyrin repeat-containing domain, partial [Cinara cedri]
DCPKGAIRAQGYFHNSNLNKLLNYRNQDQDDNSLLHKAVFANNTDAINTLLVNDVNSLAINNKDQTPFALDGISLSAKSVLTEGIREQSKRYKENTMAMPQLLLLLVFSTIGVGADICLLLGDRTNSCRIAVVI